MSTLASWGLFGALIVSLLAFLVLMAIDDINDDPWDGYDPSDIPGRQRLYDQDEEV